MFPGDLAARHLLACNEEETWPLGKLDALLVALPLAGKLWLLLLVEPVVWLAVGEAGVTVDSCSCISIMWSPNRIVRLSGALPDKKSFTCESLRLSKACITLCSGRCAWNNGREKRDDYSVSLFQEWWQTSLSLLRFSLINMRLFSTK